MAQLGFHNSKVVLPDGVCDLAAISVDQGMIAAFGDTAAVDEPAYNGLLVLPGFIDIHDHGAVGVDVNTADAAGLLKVAEFLARNGVTAWMPTLVPDTDDNYQRAIDAINELMVIQADKPVAQPVGVHYEGVFANEHMCGALRAEHFQTWDRSVSERTTPSAQSGGHPSFVRRGAAGLPKLDSGVHMTTLAPEVDGGIELIEALVGDGWIVSIGHTRADTETLELAFAAGARHMTHFFNAMTGVHHRDIGVAGWGLANEDVTFDIIADGIHVAPAMLDLACRVKSPAKVSLISDSVAPTGLGDGEYELWGERISVTNGRTRNERGSIAGSVITINDAVRTMRSLGFNDVEIARMASTNPAKLLGLDDERGTIEVGKRADLVGIHANGEIAFTMVGGEIVSKS